eukprot:8725083-Alexandrium_andersonii.AAC.1
MSASLVGSEMCIRDRSQGSALGSTYDSAQGFALGSAQGSARSPAQSSTCLLYTSDAADDM